MKMKLLLQMGVAALNTVSKHAAERGWRFKFYSCFLVLKELSPVVLAGFAGHTKVVGVLGFASAFLAFAFGFPCGFEAARIGGFGKSASLAFATFGLALAFGFAFALATGAIGRSVFAVGTVDNDFAVAYLGALHFADDEVGIFFGNFEERAVGGEVNTSYLDLGVAYVAIDKVDDFACIEIVAFAEVDEQALVAFFGLVRTALFAATLTTGFVGIGCRTAVGGLLNLGSIGIVAQEVAELAADNALDEVFLGEPFELAEISGRKGEISVSFTSMRSSSSITL